MGRASRKRRTSRRRVSRRRVSRKKRVTRREKVVRRRRARKRVSIRGTRTQVFRGSRQKVKTSGLTKKDLMKSKRGKIISKKKQSFHASTKDFRNHWILCHQKRKQVI